MSELNFEAEFVKLTEKLKDIPEHSESLSLVDVSTFVGILGETTMQLTRWLTMVLGGELELTSIPDNLDVVFAETAGGCLEIAHLMHGITCGCDEYEDDEEEDEDESFS